jgi:hypothetical protein
MDAHVYEASVHFNQGLTRAFASLDVIEKLELAALDYLSKVRANLSDLCSYANNHFAFKIAQQEQEDESNFYRPRRYREKAEKAPNKIYLELKFREELRRQHGLPPRAVILPWAHADNVRVLAMQKAAPCSLPIQPEQPRIVGDNEQKNQRGGTPT